MKKITLLLAFLFVALFSVNAQEWQTDMDKAKEIATTESKNIVLVFQGSDWCAPCIKLDREIWSTDEFKPYANEHFVMIQADFPRKKKNKLSKEQQKKNGVLAETYNKQGVFPFVVVLNGKGEVLGTTGYKKVNPTEYIKILTSF